MSIGAINNARASWFERAAAVLTALAVATAPFDELLVVEAGGLTFRFSLAFIAAACPFLLLACLQRKMILLPVGTIPLALLMLLNGALSLVNRAESLAVQIGYQAWFMLDVALVVLCVNLLSDEPGRRFLFLLWTGVFVAMSLVCVAQMVLGIRIAPFFLEQYLGNLPRCDAFLSEPSYYACFVLPGWVTFAWLLEQGEEAILARKTQWCVWLLLTGSLMFCTSRMGILLSALWLGFRLAAAAFARDERKWIRLRTIVLQVLATLAFLGLVWVCYSAVQTLNVPGFSDRLSNLAGSDVPRIEGMLAALQAFRENHLWVGSSLGGSYAATMLVAPEGVWQVSNLCAELLVSFGIPGSVVLATYLFLLVKKSAEQRKNEPVVMALLWGLLWQLGVLQFNNNGLRIYLWVNIALLSTYLPVRSTYLPVRSTRLRTGKRQ